MAPILKLLAFLAVLSCAAATRPAVCNLPSVTGMCKASFTRYFFNADTKKCEEFIYGGCGGNKNNFNTLEECEKMCETEPEMSICEGPPEKPEISICEPPPRIPEPEISICEPPPRIPEPEICNLPSEPGMCRAYMPRYFFNSNTMKCEQFIYGGCGGNKNKFNTIEECEKTCGHSVCNLPSEPGMCKAYMPRFFFNTKTKKCERFIYGGCGGNKNRFNTIEECEKMCGHSEPKVVICIREPPPRMPKPEVSICFPPPVEKPVVVVHTRPAVCNLNRSKGKGTRRFKRYYFSRKYKKCRKFRYRGKGGNGNNFRSIKDCKKKCH